jgi:hypothetical protein
VRYLCWQLSGDLAYHEALVRFNISNEEYWAFAPNWGHALLAISGPNVQHLSIDWSLPAEADPLYWRQPLPKTPSDDGRQPGRHRGIIAMKWESGRIYVLIVDIRYHSPADADL